MTDVSWLACHSRSPLQRARVERWADAAERTLAVRLGGRTRSMLVGNHIALVCWRDPRSAPKTWAQVEHADGALGVHHGFPIGFERLGLASPSPLALARAVREDVGLIDRMHPPYANAAIDEGTLSVAIDTLGFARVFHATTGSAMVWASTPTLASLFAFGALDYSEDGWVSLLSHDRFLGDASPIAGVVLEAPRTLVTARDKPHPPSVARTDYLRPLFVDTPPPDRVAERVDDAIAGVYRSMGLLGLDRLVVTLSGGRDSRVVASVALARATVDEFFTSTPPELDLQVAEQLMRHVDPRIRWTKRDKGVETRTRDADARHAGRTTAEVWDRLIGFQAAVDGEGGVTPQVAGPGSGASMERIWIWGHGGEFGRGFYYDEKKVEIADLRTRRFWWQMRKGSALVDADARRRYLRPRVNSIVDELERHEVREIRQLDYFFIFQRIRRVKNRYEATNGVRPHFSIDHIRVTHGMSAIERVRTRHYDDIVVRNHPPWAGIPYTHELKATDAAALAASTAASHADAFWQGPLIEALGDELMERIERQRLVVPDEAAAIVKPAERSGTTGIANMRLFNRLLNYVSYQAYLEAVGRDFRAAGGTAGVPDESAARDP